jgi:hypothetical protein
LVCISQHLPLCLISSKDFAFLHERSRFASILSCVLGIDTFIHNSHFDDKKVNDIDCINTQYLIANEFMTKAYSFTSHCLNSCHYNIIAIEMLILLRIIEVV